MRISESAAKLSALTSTATAAAKIFGACLRKLCRAARERLHSGSTVAVAVVVAVSAGWWLVAGGWLSPQPATQRVAGDRRQWRYDYDIIHDTAANAIVELDNIYFSLFLHGIFE